MLDKPQPRAPDIDIELPALRAQRDAAIALAEAPDDPWTLAESLAPAAPDKLADKSRCGKDELPRYAEPEVRDGVTVVDEIAAASPRYHLARARIDAQLRTSPDPFDRAVADWLDVGQMRSPAGRVEALVQQAATTSNARLYALAYRTCLVDGAATPACTALTAGRWAELDPGNGVPWTFAFEEARKANDRVGQQEALARMAAASRFDEYRFAPAAAVAARSPDNDRDLASVGDLAIEAVQQSLRAPTPVNSLLAVCRANAGGDAARAQQCEAIGDVMFERTDSVLLRGMSGVLQFATTGDESRRDVTRAEAALSAKAWSPATGFSECQEMRDTLKGIRRDAEIGEVEAARERARVFVTP